MSFIHKFKIDVDKIPDYPDFNTPFHIEVNLDVAKSIVDTLPPESKHEFAKLMQCIHNDTLYSNYTPRHGLGRYYPDRPTTTPSPHYSNLCAMPKAMKDTLFHHGGFVDYDQVKGHATLLYDWAFQEGIVLDAYHEYLTRFEDMVQELSVYYSTDVALTRSHIKDLFNRTIYGGGHKAWVDDIQAGRKRSMDGTVVELRSPIFLQNIDVPHDTYCRFKKETDMLIQKIYSSNPDIQDMVCKSIPDLEKNTWKRRNRVMSYVCGTLEHFVTYQAYTYAYTHGMCKRYTVDWAYDGFTFQPTCSAEELVDHEVAMNAFVREQTGWKHVCFIQKPFTRVVPYTRKVDIPSGIMDMQKFIQLECPYPTFSTYHENPKLSKAEQKKAEALHNYRMKQLAIFTFQRTVEMKCRYFEQFHAKILQPPMFIRYANRTLYMLNPQKITQQYEHIILQNPCKIVPDKFTDIWRARTSIKSFENLDFLPPPRYCPLTTLNTFTGLYAETLPSACVDISLFFYQLNLLCGEDDKAADYVLNWMAHRVQRPGDLPRSALVFIGEQGTGKNMLWDAFGTILGQDYYLLTDNFEKVMGRFNMNHNKLLVVLDEVRGRDGFEYSESIKALITTPTLAWEEKGINPVIISNCAGMVFFSNGANGTPVKIEYGDRRMSAYQCSSKHKGDCDYFTKLFEFFQNTSTLRTIYDHLMQRDISRWRSEQDRVLTDFYRELQSSNRPAMSVYLEQKLTEYELHGTITQTNQLSAPLFAEFKSWLSENGFTKLDYNSTRFGRELVSYGGIDKRHSRAGAMYTFDFTELRTSLVKKGHIPGCLL